jgi:HAD superfamily hydrolase (TIGR01509 family)
MNKAFIFDLDGVLIDDEKVWNNKKQELYLRLFGKEVTEKMGSTLGINMDGIYDKAVAAGTHIAKGHFLDEFFKLAADIYNTAPIPDGIKELTDTLINLNYHIGIVSASPLSWITTVTKRLTFEDQIEFIISLHEDNALKHKPEPDGYLEAMWALGASPKNTIVLEDSNLGIKSARAAGAYTIGLKQNLVDDYKQVGADAYAETIIDVIDLVKEKSASLL